MITDCDEPSFDGNHTSTRTGLGGLCLVPVRNDSQLRYSSLSLSPPNLIKEIKKEKILT